VGAVSENKTSAAKAVLILCRLRHDSSHALTKRRVDPQGSSADIFGCRATIYSICRKILGVTIQFNVALPASADSNSSAATPAFFNAVKTARAPTAAAIN
jgi:hypothetical protein